MQSSRKANIINFAIVHVEAVKKQYTTLKSSFIDTDVMSHKGEKTGTVKMDANIDTFLYTENKMVIPREDIFNLLNELNRSLQVQNDNSLQVGR